MGMFGLSLFDIPFLTNNTSLGTDNIPNDTFETYADGSGVNGQNGGVNGTHLFTISWTSPYNDRIFYFGVIALDTFESYSDGAALNGLNGQTTEERGSFTGAYVNKNNP